MNHEVRRVGRRSGETESTIEFRCNGEPINVESELANLRESNPIGTVGSV